MLSKFAIACLATAATAAEQYGNYKVAAHYSAPSYSAPNSYGSHGAYGNSYGLPWTRISTYRPRDLSATNVKPVDDFWKGFKEDETIKATCEFDFLGNTYSNGSISLSQKPGDLVEMLGEFEGLNPGLHALRVHEWGDMEAGCESLGDVFNPFGTKRGYSHLDILNRRVGDIRDIQARWDNNAEYKNRDSLIELSGPNSIIGRSMVVYEREDDFDRTEHPPIPGREARYREGQGERIACCVIGLAKGVKPAPKVQSHYKQPPSPPSYYGSNHGYGGYGGYAAGGHGHAGHGAGYGYNW